MKIITTTVKSIVTINDKNEKSRPTFVVEHTEEATGQHAAKSGLEVGEGKWEVGDFLTALQYFINRANQ